jgi:hypothetical protein
LNQLGAAAYTERGKILFDDLCGAGLRFDERSVTRAAAEGFDGDGSGARAHIDEKRIVHGGAEDVEKSFAQTIAGGAHFQPARAYEWTAAKCSGDDAHD